MWRRVPHAHTSRCTHAHFNLVKRLPLPQYFEFLDFFTSSKFIYFQFKDYFFGEGGGKREAQILFFLGLTPPFNPSLLSQRWSWVVA